MAVKAIIFDLDGVLVSTDVIHKESLLRAVYEVSVIDAFTFPVISEKSMSSTRQKLKAIQDYYHFSDDIYARILKRKDEIFLNRIKSLTVSQNVIECLQYIKSKKIKTAIASNSRMINIQNILSITDLGQYFDVVVSADEVVNRKPAPDILFEVYRRLKLRKSSYADTMFIEDSDEGVRAGEASPSLVLRINNPTELTISLIESWICI